MYIYWGRGVGDIDYALTTVVCSLSDWTSMARESIGCSLDDLELKIGRRWVHTERSKVLSTLAHPVVPHPPGLPQ